MNFEMDLSRAIFPALITLHLSECCADIKGSSFPALRYLYSESDAITGAMDILSGEWPALETAKFMRQGDGPVLRENFPSLKRLYLIRCFDPSLEGKFPNLRYLATKDTNNPRFSTSSLLNIRWRSYDGGSTWSSSTMPISTNGMQNMPQLFSTSEVMDFDDGN